MRKVCNRVSLKKGDRERGKHRKSVERVGRKVDTDGGRGKKRNKCETEDTV